MEKDSTIGNEGTIQDASAMDIDDEVRSHEEELAEMVINGDDLPDRQQIGKEKLERVIAILIDKSVPNDWRSMAVAYDYTFDDAIRLNESYVNCIDVINNLDDLFEEICKVGDPLILTQRCFQILLNRILYLSGILVRRSMQAAVNKLIKCKSMEALKAWFHEDLYNPKAIMTIAYALVHKLPKVYLFGTACDMIAITPFCTGLGGVYPLIASKFDLPSCIKIHVVLFEDLRHQPHWYQPAPLAVSVDQLRDLYRNAREVGNGLKRKPVHGRPLHPDPTIMAKFSDYRNGVLVDLASLPEPQQLTAWACRYDEGMMVYEWIDAVFTEAMPEASLVTDIKIKTIAFSVEQDCGLWQWGDSVNTAALYECQTLSDFRRWCFQHLIMARGIWAKMFTLLTPGLEDYDSSLTTMWVNCLTVPFLGEFYSFFLALATFHSWHDVSFKAEYIITQLMGTVPTWWLPCDDLELPMLMDAVIERIQSIGRI